MKRETLIREGPVFDRACDLALIDARDGVRLRTSGFYGASRFSIMLEDEDGTNLAEGYFDVCSGEIHMY